MIQGRKAEGGRGRTAVGDGAAHGDETMSDGDTSRRCLKDGGWGIRQVEGYLCIVKAVVSIVMTKESNVKIRRMLLLWTSNSRK
jgi:hypothetical protein